MSTIIFYFDMGELYILYKTKRLKQITLIQLHSFQLVFMSYIRQ